MMTTPTNYIQTYYDEVYGNTDKRMHFILIKFTLLNVKTYIKYYPCSTKYSVLYQLNYLCRL